MPTIASALLLCLLGPSASPPRLRLDLVFEGRPMLPRLEASAMAEVTNIWAEYGVDARASTVNSVNRDGAVRLAVVLADQPDRHLANGALGSIQFLGDAPQPAIVMYPDTIAALVSNPVLLGRANLELPTALRDIILGRVLGRALAHEIGHYLLRSTGHSAVGLMRAHQFASDLVARDRHCFGLSADEVMRLASVMPVSSQ